jgi:sugar phosphate isomerase/epimerase
VQYDPYWTTNAGANVLDAIEALGPHLFALHLKDGPVGGPNEAQVAVGKGDLPIREYLAAVSTAVPRVISLDLYSGDAFAAVVESKRWLEIESSRASR